MSEIDALARSLVVLGTEVTSLELGGRWGKHRRTAPAGAKLYAALHGGSELVVAGRSLSIGPGELAFLPRADEHVIRDSAATPIPRDGSACVGMQQAAADVWSTEAPATTSLVVVDLRLDHGDAPWLALLPAVVHIHGDDRELGRWLADTLALLGRARTLSPSLRETITASWAQALFARALRDAGDSLPAAEALRDDRIVAALLRLRAEPEKPWELGELAAQVGMSRSVLAARTTALLGEPLGSYLRRLRLDRAASLLATTDASVKAIAARVGYASEPAFTRAFARARGVAPNAYRRALRQAAAGSQASLARP
ncbi:helix-turn-helix domain-containing protein [Nannocystis punicea]|uniref:AraC family transcriptional regulator n=1 Tax=Nannocystis punicea TaxID=2995304 RepID=A0ABY7HAZ6_9BACT|nr:AraC family transcriptional regulator [Nannocystis poenicansa]WAS96450.1 AraC family transcriptional regulator [Nannocystis poenicansa]